LEDGGDRLMGGRMGRWLGGWVVGWVDGWEDGWMATSRNQCIVPNCLIHTTLLCLNLQLPNVHCCEILPMMSFPMIL
jgi:hypothetical protein